MDLNQPQRIGYERAYIRLWLHVPDPLKRTEEELADAAAALLRACIQHFRTGLIRLSKVVTSIADGSPETFLDRGFALLDSKDTDDFRANCNVLLVDYPDIKPWMAWYKREPVARMLFKSERTMEADIWDSIPETTNAEEAMHWKLYAGLGRDHDFFYGVEAILKAAQHFEQRWRAARRELIQGIHVLALILLHIRRRYQASTWKGRTLEGDQAIHQNDKTGSCSGCTSGVPKERWSWARHPQSADGCEEARRKEEGCKGREEKGT